MMMLWNLHVLFIRGISWTHKVSPDPIPMTLIRQVKEYERLASYAIRNRSISTAIDALMVHPLVNSYSYAKKLVDRYIELNQDYIGGWH